MFWFLSSSFSNSVFYWQWAEYVDVAVEIPVPFHARIGEVKLNTWEDGIWNLWFLVTKMRDFR